MEIWDLALCGLIWAFHCDKYELDWANDIHFSSEDLEANFNI